MVCKMCPQTGCVMGSAKVNSVRHGGQVVPIWLHSSSELWCCLDVEEVVVVGVVVVVVGDVDCEVAGAVVKSCVDALVVVDVWLLSSWVCSGMSSESWYVWRW